jgi:hypothetical protein
MPWVGFQPTIPVFERAKIVHASDHEVTVVAKVAISTKNALINKVMQILFLIQEIILSSYDVVQKWSKE